MSRLSVGSRSEETPRTAERSWGGSSAGGGEAANSGSYSISSGVSVDGPERSRDARTQSHSSCSSLRSPSSKEGARGPWPNTRRRSSAAASSSSRRMERRRGGRSRRGRRGGASRVTACGKGGRTEEGSSRSSDRPRRGRRRRCALPSRGAAVGLVSSGVVGSAAPRPNSMNQSSSLSSHSHFFSFMSLFK